MSDLEKINIYVPEETGIMLKNDALLFEVFKKDGKTINMNRFLTLLIKGYYAEYLEETYNKHKQIVDVLQKTGLNKAVINDISESILNTCILPNIPLRKGKNPCRLSLKPTNDIEQIIIMLINKLKGRDFVSQYFCKMFVSYCSKTVYEREKIIFKENYELAEKMCKEKQVIRFFTTWNKEYYHEVIPYMVTHKDNYNYLIGEENIADTKTAVSYRLNRFGNILPTGKKGDISPKTLHYLKLMKKYDPAYTINEDNKICVWIPKNSVSSFIRIYKNRPTPLKIVEQKEGCLYYFDCSADQVFLYFKKFEAAEILAPEALRNRIIEYHKNALSQYEKES